jgi:uncharacterized Tic20 family protein
MENQPISAGGPEPSGNQLKENSNDRNMAVLAHLGGILFGFIPSLIIWLVKKDESPFVDAAAKEALNFQIFIAICYFISVILMIAIIGVLLIFIVWIADITFCIIAGVKTANGEIYKYPVTLRLIK